MPQEIIDFHSLDDDQMDESQIEDISGTVYGRGKKAT